MSRQVDVRALKVARLREEVGALERVGGGAAAADGLGAGRLRFGVAAIDRFLGGGLRAGRLHEFCGPAALGLVVLLAGRARGDVLWCGRQGGGHDLYPPGLVSMGLDPRCLIHARVRSSDDLYWVAEEGLRSKAVRAVVVEAGCAMGLTVARRLQLAAEVGAVPALVLNEDVVGNGGRVACPVTAICPVAATRWRVGFRRRLETAGEGARNGPGNCAGGFELALVRNKTGGLGRWQVEWDETTHRLCLAAAAGDGPDCAL